MSKKICEVCGRELENKSYSLCDRHYMQIKEFGVALDENQRDERDLNEVEVYEDHLEILLYDQFQNELEKRVIIDKEDFALINKYRWDKRQSCIVSNHKGKTLLIQQVIMQTDEKVVFLDGDFYNCKKDNLKVVEKKRKVKRVDKRKKGKIDITSLGTSTIDVTGSCWSIEYDKSDGTRGLILLENGISQGGTTLEDYNANKRMADYIPYDRAEFIIYGHPHGDHMLLSPAGISRGFKGEAIMTKEMKAIGEKLLLDGSFIHDKHIKELHRMGKKVEPLFTESDTYLFMNKIRTVEKYDLIKLNDEVSMRYVNNSHVIGACQIELFIRKPSNHISHIVYTSDLGSKLNLKFQPFLQENEMVKKADILICESTYGSSTRGFTKEDCIRERKDLINTIHKTINRGSKCLIPSFSFSRSQTLMCMLYEEFKDVKDLNAQFIIDSRLTCEINSVYREILEGDERDYWNEVMAWDRFKFITNYKDTLELATKNDGIPRIILSSSGFMEVTNCFLC